MRIDLQKFIPSFLILCISISWQSGLSQKFQDSFLEDLMKKHQWQNIIREIETEKMLQKYQPDVAKEAYYTCLLSEAYFKRGDIASSKRHIRKAIHLATASQDSVLVYRIYLMQVQILNTEGQLSDLHDYLDPAFSYASRYRHDKLLHDCYISLGVQYLQNGKASEALDMYKNAKRISEKNQWRHLFQMDDVNLGLTYCFLQQLDSAKVCLDRAIPAAKEQKDSLLLATSYIALGYYHLMKNDRKRWKEEIIKSLEIAEKIQHPAIIATGFSQLMEYSLSEKKYEEAILMGNKAYQSISQNKAPLFHAHVDSLMYEAYKNIGNDQAALRFFENYYRGNSSILSKGQAEKLEDIKRNFELQGKNLKIQNQALELANSKKRGVILIVSNGFLLLLLVGGYLFIRNRKILQTTLYKKEKMTGLLFKQEKLLVGTSEETQVENRFTALENDLKSKSHESLYDTKDKRDLYISMIQAIEEQKLYLNPNLDINLIVTTLGTNKFYLYQAISNHASENFRNIINRYRVEEAKRLLEKFANEKSMQNIESIHSEAGFNSPSSYYRIFKNMTGLTPKEYLQEYLRDVQRDIGK